MVNVESAKIQMQFAFKLLQKKLVGVVQVLKKRITNVVRRNERNGK